MYLTLCCKQNKKMIIFFIYFFFIFTAVKNRCILHGHVFVMFNLSLMVKGVPGHY